jgi:hypothetical protein
LHKVETEALKKPYVTTLSAPYSPDGKLTVNVLLFYSWWIISAELKVSQSKVFFISFASPRLFSMQLQGRLCPKKGLDFYLFFVDLITNINV